MEIISDLQDDVPRDGIFVSIPSYRDPLISDTVKQCLAHAKFKHRIYIGVCQQNAPEDIKITPSEKVLVDYIPYQQARGPCYARERIEKLLLDQVKDKVKYVLYIDAHTLFAPNWDELVENLWLRENNEKVFFTGYPPQYTHLTRTKRHWRKCANDINVFMRSHKFIGNGMPLYLNHHLHSNSFKMQKSAYCIGLSAGFMFAPKEMVLQVPYLTNVPFSFFGEEPAMLLLYFTHGFVPKTCTHQIVQTTYSRKGRPLFFDRMTRDQKMIIRLMSNRKIRSLLEGKETDIGSIGKEKTVEEFERFVGIDFKRGIMTRDAQCGISGLDSNEDLLLKFGTDNKRVIYNRFRVVQDKKRPAITF